MKVKKVVNIYGETSGVTSETALSLNVGSETGKSYYTVPQGWKLKIYEVDAWGDGETWFYLRAGTSTTATDNPKYRAFKLASNGHLDRSYHMPLIIEATSADVYVFLTVNQSTANPAGIGLHGELEKLA